MPPRWKNTCRATFVIAIACPVLAGTGDAFAQLGRPPSSARDTVDNAGTVRGPISDFWFKIRSEWSGYLQASSSPLAGGAGAGTRTLGAAPPGRVWVSLAHSSLPAEGPGAPLTHLFKEFLSEWKKGESRNWPYAQIYDRTWEKMGQAGRRQNIILIGTPWALAPVGPLASGLGISISKGKIDIGKRKYRGDNLILVFIAPNPENPEKYALVITGSGDEALLQANQLPYGATDYAIFRGRRLLESGSFSRPAADRWGPPETWEATGSHAGFAIRESAHYTIWFERERLSREALDDFVRQKEEAWPSLVGLVPAAGAPARPEATGQKLTWYLYPSVDRKIDETAREEMVHVDLAAGEVHAVFSAGQRIDEPWLDLMLLIHRRIGPTRVPRLERALAIALAGAIEGRPLTELAAPVLAETRRGDASVLRSLRDHDVMTPADGPPSTYDLLLAAFVRDLVLRAGPQKAARFVERASPHRIDDAFEEACALDLRREISRWASSLAQREPMAAAVTTRTTQASGESPADDGSRDRAEHARAMAARARAQFRSGELESACDAAREAIRSCDVPGDRAEAIAAVCPDAMAWSRVTLGRVEAMRGHLLAARVELTHASVINGPEGAAILADYWLETMGESRNQLTVVTHRKRGARVALRSLDWKRAEDELKQALEIDPADGEAHRLLSEVYHKQHEYWAWRIRFLNEIHPDYTLVSQVRLPGTAEPIAVRLDPLHSVDSFNDLVLRGNVELLRAQSLYAIEIQNLHNEGDRWLIERKEPPEALKIYRRALELNTDFYLSHFLVGRCLFLMERYAEARLVFEDVLSRRPEDSLVRAWTHTYLGYIALEEDAPLKVAEQAFDRALASSGSERVIGLAREGLGKVETIRLLQPGGSPRR